MSLQTSPQRDLPSVLVGDISHDSAPKHLMKPHSFVIAFYGQTLLRFGMCYGKFPPGHSQLILSYLPRPSRMCSDDSAYNPSPFSCNQNFGTLRQSAYYAVRCSAIGKYSVSVILTSRLLPRQAILSSSNTRGVLWHPALREA